MCGKMKKSDEAFLGALFEKKDKEAYLIGAAYEGSPTKEKALVFAFDGKEYLVPFINVWDGSRVVESTVRLDLVERVESRPHETSRISEMLRSSRVTAEARAALEAGARAWFLPEKGYKVRIIPFKA